MITAFNTKKISEVSFPIQTKYIISPFFIIEIPNQGCQTFWNPWGHSWLQKGPNRGHFLKAQIRGVSTQTKIFFGFLGRFWTNLERGKRGKMLRKNFNFKTRKSLLVFLKKWNEVKRGHLGPLLALGPLFISWGHQLWFGATLGPIGPKWGPSGNPDFPPCFQTFSLSLRQARQEKSGRRERLKRGDERWK